MNSKNPDIQLDNEMLRKLIVEGLECRRCRSCMKKTTEIEFLRNLILEIVDIIDDKNWYQSSRIFKCLGPDLAARVEKVKLETCKTKFTPKFKKFTSKIYIGKDEIND